MVAAVDRIAGGLVDAAGQQLERCQQEQGGAHGHFRVGVAFVHHFTSIEPFKRLPQRRTPTRLRAHEHMYLISLENLLLARSAIF
jgi:hypothetical protein